MRNKRFLILIVAALALGMSFCPAIGAQKAAKNNKIKVVLILPGNITGGAGWDTLAYEGLKTLKKEGFVTAFTEGVTTADIPEMTRGYADDGFDLIIGHGFQFGSVFKEIAPEYPNQKFFASTNAPAGKIPETFAILISTTSTPDMGQVPLQPCCLKPELSALLVVEIIRHKEAL